MGVIDDSYLEFFTDIEKSLTAAAFFILGDGRGRRQRR